ncbi:MAG: FAD-dependent oxidoreductase [Deltaproteobacteria bacterium]|nr:FAD-dependent oxidoreductase [Deltaproteobacteria bacterium]
MSMPDKASTSIREPARDTPVRHEAEVLVVGGGAAGVAAAVAAARSGADVLLVERHGSLGGLATGGLIILLLTLDDGRGRQAVAGLCQQVTDRLDARGAAFFPPPGEWGVEDPEAVERARRWGLVWGRPPHRVRYSVAYDPAMLKGVLDEMLRDAGARLLLHAWACEPILEGNRIGAVTFQSKAGRFAVRARVVIDATGDGDLFAAAGCAEEKTMVLPWMWFTVGGVDVDRAIEAGVGCFQTIGQGKVLLPWGSIEKVGRIDATRPEDLTRAEVECRRRVLAEFERLRREAPGFADAHLCQVADQLGITESRRLVGRSVLSHQQMNVVLDDAVAVTGHWTKYDALYHIPYGALLPRELENLLVAGRCISVDHRVHQATKEIPACMASGEAAGTAAALAIRTGVDPSQLDVSQLRGELVERGAIVSLAPGG